MGLAGTRYGGLQLKMIVSVAALIVGFGVVLGKAYQLQGVKREAYEGKQQGQTKRGLKMEARRGSILDRNGVEVAASAQMPLIYADPAMVEDPAQTFALLREALGEGFDEKRVRERLGRRERRFEVLARRVDPAAVERLQALRKDKQKAKHLKAIGVHHESVRFYPLRSRAGQLLGFLGQTETDDVQRGRAGLELAFDEDLQGDSYSLDVITDVRGQRIYQGEAPDFDRLEGDDLVLTLDERIQHIAEAELMHQAKSVGAESGSVIVSDPRTGDIYAMASYPLFNPNRPEDSKGTDAAKNRATQELFEPGSTFKCFTIAAGLDSRVVGYHTRIDTENGALRLAEFTVKDTHRESSMETWEVMKYSSNVGAIKINRMLGKERALDYWKRFGFGEKPNVHVPAEAGRVPRLKGWKDIDFDTVGYGYGINLTHMQLHMAVGAIANDGVRNEPRLVSEVRLRDGQVRRFPPKVAQRVLSPEAARQTRDAMVTVTEKGGTGTGSRVEGFTVAGKTGTAKGMVEREVVVKGVTKKVWRYDDLFWRGSFVGFVMRDDEPLLEITVLLNTHITSDEQRHKGGQVAAPVFSRIAEQALPLLGEYPATASKLEAPALALAEVAPEEDGAQAGELEGEGGGEAGERVHAAPSKVVEIHEPTVEVEGGLSPAPSYLGLSLRQALKMAQERGHQIEIECTGRVQSQSPGPGTFVSPGAVIRLRCE